MSSSSPSTTCASCSTWSPASAAMEDVLARLARGELTNPLRSLMLPPGDGTAMGLMPSHAGGDAPVFALKEIVVVGANSARGLDPHQGSVLLHDGDERKADRDPQRLADHRDPHGGRLRRGHEARSHAPARAPSPCSAPASRAAPTSTRCRPCSTIRSSGSGAATTSHAEALALETHSLVAASVEEAVDGADVVCTATSAAEPIVRARLARARDARQRRRRVPERAVARARRRHRRLRAPLRRPARVDAERVG